MASASSVFIVGTIVLACSAPYHAHRIKDASAAPELLDLHENEIIKGSRTFLRVGLKKQFGKCCCDKHGTGSNGITDIVKGSFDIAMGHTGEIRTKRCAFFKVDHCGDVTIGKGEAKWATARLHSYEKTENQKCEVTNSDLSLLVEYFSKEDARPGTVLFDLHVELLNSKTFHLEGIDRFGKCCCDKDKEIVHGMDVGDTWSSLKGRLKNERPVERSGQCGIFEVKKTCGEVGYNGAPKRLNADWANSNLHDYKNTKNGSICSLSSKELAPIRDYFEKEDERDLYDLDTVMSAKFQETKKDISAFGRCCCDKMLKTMSASLALKPATSGRCGLFANIGKCGEFDAEWKMQSLHNYEDVQGTKCALTEGEIEKAFNETGVVASYQAKAVASQEDGSQKYIDVHVALMNSETFQLDQDFSYFEARFGRCCCDQDAKGWSYGAQRDRVKKAERTGICELQSVGECGVLSGGTHSHDWQTTEGGGKCVILKTAFDKIQSYYEEQDLDRLNMHDLHTVMAKSYSFKDGPFTTQDETFKTEFGRCCCDKPVNDKKTVIKTLWKPFTSGRCGLFKNITSCGDVPTKLSPHNSDEIWARDFGALNKLHEYINVDGGKCALTEKQLGPLLKRYDVEL